VLNKSPKTGTAQRAASVDVGLEECASGRGGGVTHGCTFLDSVYSVWPKRKSPAAGRGHKIPDAAKKHYPSFLAKESKYNFDPIDYVQIYTRRDTWGVAPLHVRLS